ncbi:alpha,alpha-trehalase TreF [Mucilaginibacter litoreus]|uniref:Alpha,alpha-trehalase TreF n=1 Tax=Mucilaginibacter litoreus TaxID=1048221 RepID=A0ABW3AMX0_9SPHI
MKILQKTPRQLFPGLFESVQSSNIFPDNKTFVDCAPKHSPDEIMKAYNEHFISPDFDLKAFVHDHFEVPEAHTIFHTHSGNSIRKHIDILWGVLQRKHDIVIRPSSLAALPHPYIVPGGRFREIYYWDSYFTMLGLQEDKQFKVIENMVNNFAYLIDTYGFIPNGNRSYYLTRSQPPFFALMVNLLSQSHGEDVFIRYLPQLQKEYDYWMDGSEQLEPNQAACCVARMEDGALLNRYWDGSDQPREEAYIKDIDEAVNTKQSLPDFFRNIRAAAASGWDFSSRWFDGSMSLCQTRTTDYLPVDLNCLMYYMELSIARGYRLKGDEDKSNEYQDKAGIRKKAILKYFWDDKTNWFYDYNRATLKLSGVQTLAAVYPLDFKIATADQAKHIANGLQEKFLKAGGLLTSLNFSGQQWDAPNGWAPLQYMAVTGLEQYGHSELAKAIADRWIHLNICVFEQTGKLLEKYNVIDPTATAGGGEYALQDGFGWTNGVLLKLMNKYNYDGKPDEAAKCEFQVPETV